MKVYDTLNEMRLERDEYENLNKIKSYKQKKNKIKIREVSSCEIMERKE